MHDTVTYMFGIEAIYITVHAISIKLSSQLYISADVVQLGAFRSVMKRLLVPADCASLFCDQKCSLVGIPGLFGNT